MFTVVGLFILLVWRIIQVLLGMTPEQRAAENAKRIAREQERAFSEQEHASRLRQEEWYRLVEMQKSRGAAGFASEADAIAALRARGGRQSNLDARKF
jgi:hypothetical protein